MGLLDKLQFDAKDDSETDAEIGYEFQPDPEPGERARPKRGKPAAAKPAPRTPAAVTKMAKQVAEDLATVIEVSAAIWGMSDDCCAPTLEQQARPIADALVGILSRNPRMLMALASSDLAVMGVQSIALGKALMPVGKAVYRNHISKAVDADAEEGTHSHGTDALRLGGFPAYTGISRNLAGAHAA